MVRAVETNLEMIRHVARRLGALRERMVFLGGVATALLITDTATPDVRITTDVDVIVEITSRVEYYRLAESLYSQALQFATIAEIEEEMTVRVVTGPYFLATKIEAFYSRGKGDFMASHDMEDIVTLLDGRPELADEIRAAVEEVKVFLSQSFRAFLLKRDFLDSLPRYLLPDSASQRRIPLLMERIWAIAEVA